MIQNDPNPDKRDEARDEKEGLPPPVGDPPPAEPQIAPNNPPEVCPDEHE